MSRVIGLQEVRPNSWKAKYKGNYGVYTIKIDTLGDKPENFSCSCPSNAYPCKHISIIQQAIREQINKAATNNDEQLLKQVVGNISADNLRKFIVRTALYNPILKQSLLLEFSNKCSEDEEVVDYRQLIKSTIQGTDYDMEDIYYNDALEIDGLDECLAQSQEFVQNGNYADAVTIAKTCIEELAEWAKNNDEDINLLDYMSEDYIYTPLQILTEAKDAGYLKAEELLEYFQAEIKKSKYKTSGIYDSIDRRILHLTKEISPESYLKNRQEAFEQLDDKTSYQARNILDEIIDYYTEQNEDEKAWNVINENLQIDFFREQVVFQLIEEKKFKDAERLVKERIDMGKNTGYYSNRPNKWDGYLLTIAQKENKPNDIRKAAKVLIYESFDSNVYKAYKATFKPDEWITEMEKLIKHYCKSFGFSYNAANLLAEENLTERLLKYMEQGDSSDVLKKYYKDTFREFPDRTIALFRKTIDSRLENTGREVYEHVIDLFKDMLSIDGGKKAVLEMIPRYKTVYKNRRAMIEMFDTFSRRQL